MKFQNCMLLLIILVLPFTYAETFVLDKEPVEKIYALSRVNLIGDLEKNSLKLSGYGDVLSGESVKIYLFSANKDFLIKNLIVNDKSASISLDEKGYYFVVDSKGEFRFGADFILNTKGQFELKIPGPMNELIFELKNGYAINGNRFGLLNENVIIQRTEKTPVFVEGNFKFSYGQKNTFYYLLNFQSYGTKLGKYTINLYNGEKVTSVDGVLDFEQNGDILSFDLSDESATVIIQGLFDSTNLRMPLSEGKHKVLIESEPEKKLTISTDAKEIDLTESNLQSTSSQARAFLASNADIFAISIKDLTVLPSLSATVNDATNTIAITKSGALISELTYNYENTGVDYIDLDIPGIPLYAGTNYGAVKLTKDEKFSLSMPKTRYGNLDLVYYTEKNALGVFNSISLPVVNYDLPISNHKTKIFVPDDYFILGVFSDGFDSELPSLNSLIIYIVIFSFVGWLLYKNIKFIVCYVIFSMGLFNFEPYLLFIFIAASLVYAIKKHLSEVIFKWVIGGFFALLLFTVFLAVIFGFFNSGIMYSAQNAFDDTLSYSVGESIELQRKAVAPSFNGVVALGSGEGSISVPTKEGVLPVKLQLPTLGKEMTIKTSLVTKEHPVSVTVWLVASWLEYFVYLLCLIVGVLGYNEFKSSKTNVKKIFKD